MEAAAIVSEICGVMGSHLGEAATVEAVAAREVVPVRERLRSNAMPADTIGERPSTAATSSGVDVKANGARGIRRSPSGAEVRRAAVASEEPMQSTQGKRAGGADVTVRDCARARAANNGMNARSKGMICNELGGLIVMRRRRCS